jgi:glutamate---methylamine ligase
MAQDLAKIAKQEKIAYFLISFADLFGVQRSKLVPASAIGEMQVTGAGFAGFATHLDMSPADPDMFAVPDPDSLTILPWKPEVAWLAADLVMAGEPVAQAPRLVLKAQIEAAAAQGYRAKTGVEAEYFLIHADGGAIADPADSRPSPATTSRR